jgi:hypothetical protein
VKFSTPFSSLVALGFVSIVLVGCGDFPSFDSKSRDISNDLPKPEVPQTPKSPAAPEQVPSFVDVPEVVEVEEEASEEVENSEVMEDDVAVEAIEEEATDELAQEDSVQNEEVVLEYPEIEEPGSGDQEEGQEEQASNEEEALEPPSLEKVYHLIAAKSYSPSQWKHDSVELPLGGWFLVPESIHIVEGNAGNHRAQIYFDEVVCSYKGGSAQSRPMGPVQWERGLVYKLEHCSQGEKLTDPEIVWAEKEIRLEVGNGDSRQTTVVEVEIFTK